MAKEHIKITKGKIGLVLKHPFFATLALKRKYISDPSTKTASTDGKVIKYNPGFIETLSHDEVMGVIAHECMHIVSLHHTRMGARDGKKWNVAADFAINGIIENAGLSLPKGRLRNPMFDGKSAEEIYKILPDGEGGEGDGEDEGEGDDGSQQPQGRGRGKGKGKGQGSSDQQPDSNIGNVEPAPAETNSQIQEAEGEAKQELAQAVQAAKMAGNLPADIARMVQEILEPKVNWKEVLARFLGDISKNDYTFSRPNPRYIGTGFVMPSLYSIEMGQVVLMVDTSGSIDNKTLNQFAGEMQDICSMYKSPIKVLYVDAEVAGEQDLEPDEPVKLEPAGGGGTDFRPGFDWLRENGIEPKAVVYLTDLCCYSYPEEPDFPVLWAATGNRHATVPFGEIVHLD